jgi:hypothetical protein
MRSIIATGLIFAATGCSYTTELLSPPESPHFSNIHAKYKSTILKESTAADVLETAYMPKYELLSQSRNVIATQGKKNRKNNFWTDIVAFDEDSLPASRKYLIMVAERPGLLSFKRNTNIKFHAEAVLDTDVLYEPYASENARRTAVLQEFLADFREDTKELSKDHKIIHTAAMMVNQAIETVLVELEASPATAVYLESPDGLEFSHINLDKGIIKMRIEDDVAEVEMIIGESGIKWWF